MILLNPHERVNRLVVKHDMEDIKYILGLIGVVLLANIIVFFDYVRTNYYKINYKEIYLDCAIEGILLLVVILGSIRALQIWNLKYVLSENGCEIYGWRGYYKTFSWEEAQSKYIVYAKDGEPGGSIKGIAVLSTRKISEKSIWYNPLKYLSVYHLRGLRDFIYYFFYPMDIVYIWFSAKPKKSDADGCWIQEKVDERIFKQKMTEWHVELEDNKPKEIPPWKEQL